MLNDLIAVTFWYGPRNDFPEFATHKPDWQVSFLCKWRIMFVHVGMRYQQLKHTNSHQILHIFDH